MIIATSTASRNCSHHVKGETNRVSESSSLIFPLWSLELVFFLFSVIFSTPLQIDPLSCVPLKLIICMVLMASPSRQDVFWTMASRPPRPTQVCRRRTPPSHLLLGGGRRSNERLAASTREMKSKWRANGEIGKRGERRREEGSGSTWIRRRAAPSSCSLPLPLLHVHRFVPWFAPLTSASSIRVIDSLLELRRRQGRAV
jgi:hypothetical protein